MMVVMEWCGMSDGGNEGCGCVRVGGCPGVAFVRGGAAGVARASVGAAGWALRAGGPCPGVACVRVVMSMWK